MLVVIKGAGDIASGIALRLHRARFNVVMTDIAQPTSIRRAVCFSMAVTEGKAVVEGITAELAADTHQVRSILALGHIPIYVDPIAAIARELKPDALVDAILAKHNTGTQISDAPVVIAAGPGFTAGVDCHAVVETQRGHYLGRAVTQGTVAPNTGIPGNIAGYTTERLLCAPEDGVFEQRLDIGTMVHKGDVAGFVNGHAVTCRIDGVLRGILPNGAQVHKGMKSGDIDPRCKTAHCFTVSDKALAIGGGVLEALMRLTPLDKINLRTDNM